MYCRKWYGIASWKYFKKTLSQQSDKNNTMRKKPTKNSMKTNDDEGEIRSTSGSAYKDDYEDESWN